ncbi:MAG: cell wall hydrolase [Sphingobium sp.]
MAKATESSAQNGLALLAAALLVVVPFIGARLAPTARPGEKTLAFTAKQAKIPPLVEPLVIKQLPPDAARTINAAVPFSAAPNPPARRFVFAGLPDDRARATACLAAAQLYEAGDDPTGQRAVAQVVLNRLRHPAFPKSVCGVVFQGAKRATGCQFTFTCDGALARGPAPAAWGRAMALAAHMLSGLVDGQVGYATHYHTDWVVPYWSSSLDKIAQVRTHLFFRWTGWWGTPPAFLRQVSDNEPKIPQLSALSPVHSGAAASVLPGAQAAALIGGDAVQIANAPLLTVDASKAGRLIGGARLVAASPTSNAFILEIPSTLAQSDYPAIARAYCSGRTECRIMAWRAGKGTPKGFPLDPPALASMIFSYIHNADSGLQRMLWNCDLIPQTGGHKCMRERVKITPTPSSVNSGEQ